MKKKMKKLNNAKLLGVFMLFGCKCVSAIALVKPISITEGENAVFEFGGKEGHVTKIDDVIFGKVCCGSYFVCFSENVAREKRRETPPDHDEVCRSLSNDRLGIPSKKDLENGSARIILRNVTLTDTGQYFTHYTFGDGALISEEYNLTVNLRAVPAVTTPPLVTTKPVDSQATIILMSPIFVAVLLCIVRFIG